MPDAVQESTRCPSKAPWPLRRAPTIRSERPFSRGFPRGPALFDRTAGFLQRKERPHGEDRLSSALIAAGAAAALVACADMSSSAEYSGSSYSASAGSPSVDPISGYGSGTGQYDTVPPNLYRLNGDERTAKGAR